MIFGKAPVAVSTNEAKIDALLSRSVVEVINRESLKKELLSGRRLRVKLGIDPTSPHLHLGRAVTLLKLKDFQDLGHTVVLIAGDFTGIIGDTSDKDAERPMLQKEIIEKNMATYKEQAGKILDLSRVEFRTNSTWLEPLGYREIGEHADQFSVSDFIARENIKRRLDEGKRVSLREVLYPLMQGYDSVAVKADVELGGTDQRFNLLAGRALQGRFGQRPQDIVMTELIPGLDGRKMSSSWGNTINLTDAPNDMFGKVMRVSDDLVQLYFTHCTRVPLGEVAEIIAGHPKEAKMRLAQEITSLYHGKSSAEKARDAFDATFSRGEVSEENVTPVHFSHGGSYGDALVAGGLVASKTEVRRLVAAGAIASVTSGKVIVDINHEPTDGEVLRIGKHRFAKMIRK